MAEPGFPLLPDDVIDPDVELEDALRVEPDDPLGDPEIYPLPPAPFGRSWHLDVVSHHFVRYGGSPAETHGVETLKVWIAKTIQTARFAHPIYDAAYGVEDPFSLVGSSEEDPSAQEYLQRVTDALLEHDRITDIDDFFVRENPDWEYLLVSFTVEIDGNDELTVEIPLGG